MSQNVTAGNARCSQSLEQFQQTLLVGVRIGDVGSVDCWNGRDNETHALQQQQLIVKRCQLTVSWATGAWIEEDKWIHVARQFRHGLERVWIWTL